MLTWVKNKFRKEKTQRPKTPAETILDELKNSKTLPEVKSSLQNINTQLD